MKHFMTRRLFALMLLVFLVLVPFCGCRSGLKPLPSGTDLSAIASQPAQNPSGVQDVSVLFINVGRADAALIQIDGLSYLIDTGTKESVPALYGALSLCGVEKLAAVFLTHTHSDHIGGMEALVKKYSVETLYSAGISMDDKDGENKIDNLASKLSLHHVKLQYGNKVNVTSGVWFEVIGPLSYNGDDDNDNSLVLRLVVNGRTFLFTGDMQFAEESTLLAKGISLSADVLKVGNHGNPDATSDAFAAAVSPKYAVISTNTSEDTDSANARVKTALSGAAIFITQDYAYGVRMNVSGDGAIQVSDPKPSEAMTSVAILSINKTAQTVTIANRGKTADLSGYFIVSEKGNEVYVFPAGTVLQSGQKLTIACLGGSGDLIWNEKNVWNEKKQDVGVLYDTYGRELSRVN